MKNKEIEITDESALIGFYCIAEEDGMVPCDAQCITCLKIERDNDKD